MGAKGSTPATQGMEWGPEYLSDYSDTKPKFCMYKDDVATIRYAAKGPAAREADGGAPEATLVQTLQRAASKWPDKPAFCVERPVPDQNPLNTSTPLDQWQTWTWDKYYKDCRAAAKAFLTLGAVRYDGIMILGFNSPEWVMAQMSAMMIGGKASGIYPTDSPAQVMHKTTLADGSVAVVGTEVDFNKFAESINDMPYLRAIVTWSCKKSDLTRSDGSSVKVMTWDELLELGNKAENDQELDSLIEATQPGNCCVLVFTSGTTGMPKAVMGSHDSINFEVHSISTSCIPQYGKAPEQERIISYLPLSHIAGMLADIALPLYSTAYHTGWTTLYFARPYDLRSGTLGDRLRSVRPTLFLGVPRVYEKIADKIKAVGAQSGYLKATISGWAKGQSKYALENQLVGKSGDAGLLYPVAASILKKVHQAIGLDQAKVILSGAAPLSTEILEYFGQLGLNINEVYGMSESTGATTWNTDECHEWGTVGMSLGGTEVCVLTPDESGKNVVCPKAQISDKPTEAEQGEICIRGRHIMMGYLANPKLGEDHVAEILHKNMETIDDQGFLHSGDKGSKSMRNMYRITGRYKEIIITAGGENIAPSPIEEALKRKCPLLSNVIMVGDQRKFNVALITLAAKGASGEEPGTDELDGAAAAFDSSISTIPEATASKTFVQAIIDALNEVNSDGTAVASNAAKIQKFTILPVDVSVQTGELTPSLKLKRSVTEAKHKFIIDQMYQSSEIFVPYRSA
mmetsp:Transcript_1691/g.3027  ORF Transcript_1691/g.3027 Transcript_1691/m.3027 type:complete len:743 (-) Transcript_1691:138-2366(-)